MNNIKNKPICLHFTNMATILAVLSTYPTNYQRQNIPLKSIFTNIF
jgi:hypothetical protein